MEASQKTKNRTTISILYLGRYPKESKFTTKDMCTSRFTAALFTISKLWKQPRCPTTEEWLKKM
jgi:hypothetical protein